MKEELRNKMIKNVITDFDFVRAAAIMNLAKGCNISPEYLVNEAIKMLKEALKHCDKEAWWIYHYPLVAYWDKRRGVYLFCTPFCSKYTLQASDAL